MFCNNICYIPSKEGRQAGIYSVCSAHSWVLRAAAEQAHEDGSLLLIEATSNQVNQAGGYTEMRPAGFRRFAEGIADAAGFDRARLVLGGDHLGPNPWRTLTPEVAMTHALEMVARSMRRRGSRRSISMRARRVEVRTKY
jgi:D-tagatose-1,6-bisphosphate aldolase subunit GatZ/KbaZ